MESIGTEDEIGKKKKRGRSGEEEKGMEGKGQEE